MMRMSVGVLNTQTDKPACFAALDLPPDAWITSDSHFGHANVARYAGRPDDHEELMLERWHERVARGDVVLHLGDLVCFARPEDWIDRVGALPGRKILLLGNHDRLPARWYREAGFQLVGGRGRARKPEWWSAPSGERVCLSHEPVRDRSGWDVNAHGHVHRHPSPPCDEGQRRANACVEMTDYAPVRLADLVQGVVTSLEGAGPPGGGGTRRREMPGPYLPHR